MTVEDFTTYIEVDPNNHIALTGTNKVSETSIHRNEDAYLYSDKGVNHFAGDFSHDFIMRAPDTSPNDSGMAFCYGLSNTVDDATGWCAHTIYLMFNNDKTYVLYFGITGIGNTAYITAGSLTVYYCTIDRIGTTVRLRMWSDAARTDLKFTRTIVDAAPITARYIYPMASNNSAHDLEESGCYIQDLDLKESAVPTVTTQAATNVEAD